MISTIPPAAIFILGALAVPFLKGRAKSAYLLMLPVAGFVNLLMIPQGAHLSVEFIGHTLTILRVDRLSLVFGYIFHIAAFLTLLYALSEKNDVEYIGGLVYSGSALGVVFAGDLLTLFFFWEAMTFGSVALIWARRSERALKAGFRYFVVHIFGGIMLLMGIVMYVYETGSIDVGQIGLTGLSTWLIFLGIGVNCAWPVLHAWLPDAYPEATVAGTVFMSAFTTKTAVYVLARTFAGTEMLIWIGAIMTVFPIFYAVIENDLRRVLSYSLINQVGFMVVGIGIGTELSLNGTAAHAFAHILYKALLFMSMGAVLRQTGKIRATDLGGLYKTMPFTAVFCMVGAASISAFPLFSGFVTKSMIVSATGYEGIAAAWVMLMFASAGGLLAEGIKVPFFAFFSHDSGLRPKEAPLNMLLAMGITAFLSVFIGVFPGFLYNMLPYPVDYVPYTVSHVLSQYQLLMYSALAFTLLMLSGVYPAEQRAINLDADWLYRKGARLFMTVLNGPLAALGGILGGFVFGTVPRALAWVGRNPVAALRIGAYSVVAFFANPQQQTVLRERLRAEKNAYPGSVVWHWSVGTAVLWITLILLAYLLVYYIP